MFQFLSSKYLHALLLIFIGIGIGWWLFGKPPTQTVTVVADLDPLIEVGNQISKASQILSDYHKPYVDTVVMGGDTVIIDASSILGDIPWRVYMKSDTADFTIDENVIGVPWRVAFVYQGYTDSVYVGIGPVYYEHEIIPPKPSTFSLIRGVGVGYNWIFRDGTLYSRNVTLRAYCGLGIYDRHQVRVEGKFFPDVEGGIFYWFNF